MSWLGRWERPDPIGLGDGLNRWMYVRGRPVGSGDPTGRAEVNTEREEYLAKREAYYAAKVEANAAKWASWVDPAAWAESAESAVAQAQSIAGSSIGQAAIYSVSGGRLGSLDPVGQAQELGAVAVAAKDKVVELAHTPIPGGNQDLLLMHQGTMEEVQAAGAQRGEEAYGYQLATGEVLVGAAVGAVVTRAPAALRTTTGAVDDLPEAAAVVDDAGGAAARVAASDAPATFGRATTTDYRSTFFEANPELEGRVVVHHAVEQQVKTRYPGLVSDEQLHSLENLRGIPKEYNAPIHLSIIRREWNRFYRAFPNPTQQQLLDQATKIDNLVGSWFDPPVRPPN